MMGCGRQTCRAFQRRDVDATTCLIIVTSRATPVETATPWSQAHFISDVLAFTGGEADGKAGALQCGLKSPVKPCREAGGRQVQIPKPSPPTSLLCVCNLSMSLICVDLKSWESQCICGTQPVNTNFIKG